MSFLLVVSLPSRAQDSQGADQAPFRIGVAVDQVFLPVNVRSVQGGFVRDLKKEDFLVLEDGVPQEIVNFYSEAVPVHVVLLIDISASTRWSQGEIRRAALRFVKELGPEDKVAIITFNDAPRLILNWSNDLEKIQLKLESIWAKGPTVLYDALYVTFDDLLKEVSGKKAVIVLTDGVDTQSMVNFDQAFRLAVRSEAMVYVVSKLEEYWAQAIAWRAELQATAQLVPKELTDGYILEIRRNLQRLAEQTGGKVLSTKDFYSLVDVYAQVAEELRNQYYISYTPSNVIRDGAWRNIEVQVRRPGVVVHTKPGYFAPSGEAQPPPQRN